MPNTHFPFPRELWKTASLGVLCILGSFFIGAETAGEVNPFASSKAESFEDQGLLNVGEAGDVNLDGVVSPEDAIAILEIALGYHEALPEQRKADPNGDGHLTVEDALRVLRTVTLR